MSDARLAAATQAPPPADEDLLGLTVHSLPHAQQASEAIDAAQRSRTGRIKMFLVLLVCAAPVIASYFTYYVIRPEGRRNFGELVTKQPMLPAVQAQTLDGKPVSLQSLQGQWLLLSVAPAACDAVCQNNLYLQRQLRESLGREKERLDLVWLVTDDAQPPLSLTAALDCLPTDTMVIAAAGNEDPARVAGGACPRPGIRAVSTSRATSRLWPMGVPRR